MQFSVCVSGLCGCHFEIIHTQSSTLFIFLALTYFLINMLPSSSPGVIIQGKTSPILSGMVALRRHSFFCLYAVLCVYQRFVWLSFWDHIHPIFHSLSKSGMNMRFLIAAWGLLYRERHLQFFLGWLPLSSSLLFLSLCSSLCVSMVFVAVDFGSYTPNLPFSFQFLHEHASSSLGVVIQGKTSPIFF